MIQRFKSAIRSSLFLFLPLFLLSLPRAAAQSVDRTNADWADMNQGATVEEQTKGRSGDVWGLLGKDGGYRWSAPYPCSFIIDLGEAREIRSLYFTGTNHGMWTPDKFTVEYLDEDSEWKILAKEDHWAGDAPIAYIKTLPAAVTGSKIRFRAEKGGLHKDISAEHKAYVTRTRGNHLLLTHFSVYPGTRVPALVEQIRDELAIAWTKAATISAQRDRIPPEMADRFDGIMRQLRSIRGILSDGQPLTDHHQDLLALKQQLDEIHRETILSRNQRLREKFRSGHLAGIAPPLERIRQDLFTGPVNHRAETWSARREAEDLQIAFHSGDKAFGNLRLEAGSLHGEQDRSIPSSNIRLHRGVYVNTQQPHYPVDHVGRHFDGLVPLDATSPPVRAEPDTTTIFWATIFTPEDQPAGKYEGTLKLYEGDTLLWEFHLIHHVWDFTLPVTSGLKNIFSISEPIWKGYYGKGWSGPGATTKGYKEFAELWLQHRLNPTNLYINSPQPPLESAPSYVEKGLNTINIGRATGPNRNEKWFKGFLARLKEDDRRVKALGLQDKAFVYLTDEPFPRDYPDLINRAKRIKEVTDLPLYAAFHKFEADFPEELAGLIDIWGPTFSVYEKHREWFQERRRKGDQVWWYFVGWGINIDQSPLRARAFPWMTWNEDLEGIMQWAANRYWHKGQTIDNWDARSFLTHNGLANYVYPGPDGAVYPSARLSHMRDGMEDYEYLHLLRTLLDREEKSPAPDDEFIRRARKALDLKSLIPTPGTIKEDPSLWTERRNEIGNLIQQKSRAAAE